MVRYAAILGLLLNSLCVTAQELKPLVLMGVKIPRLFDAQEPGPYNRIYDRLLDGYTGVYTLREAPLRRAINAFVKADVDCFLFATGDRDIYRERGMSEHALLISSPINTVELKLFGREGTPVIRDTAGLKNSYVAVDQGATNIARAAEHLSIRLEQLLPAQTLAQAFLLLNQGRVDAVMAFDSDVKIYQAGSGDLKNYSVSNGLGLGASNDSVICRQSVTSEHFISHVNAELEKLSSSGELKRILSTP